MIPAFMLSSAMLISSRHLAPLSMSAVDIHGFAAGITNGSHRFSISPAALLRGPDQLMKMLFGSAMALVRSNRGSEANIMVKFGETCTNHAPN